MSRKTDIINRLEVVILRLIESEGLINHYGLLALCIKRGHTIHSILIAEDLIHCQEFKHIVSGWKSLMGSKLEKKRKLEEELIKVELDVIRKCTHDNTNKKNYRRNIN